MSRPLREQLVSVILPSYNEREVIGDTIQGLYEQIQQPLEVIVVDDGSPDGTAEVVRNLQTRFPTLKLIQRTNARGLASAFNRGIIESQGDIVCWMDADMSMPPTVLAEMIRHLDRNDIVVGSRYAPGGKDDRAPVRTLASRLINGFAGLVLGGGIKDYDSGFVAVRRTVFDHVSIIPTGYGAYFIEFLYNAHLKGLRIHEVGYCFRDREQGVSKSFASLRSFVVLGAGYVGRILLAKARGCD
ncbi:MAG: glycosyltransferase [Planctomycetota bacterium]|nr:MAG: glycosyltransferase [Planctomycetota bacterium]